MRILNLKIVSILASLVLFSLSSPALAAPPSESGMVPFTDQVNLNIYNSTFSSNDGNPNPFNPIVTNVNNGTHPLAFFSPQPFQTSNWLIKVTKAYRGLSDEASYNTLGWINADTGARGIYLVRGASTGTNIVSNPGQQRIMFSCVTSNSYFNYTHVSNTFPMLVLAKVSVTATKATYRIYCEDIYGYGYSDYDYNDHGYLVEVYSTVCSNGLDDDGDGFVDLNDPGCKGDPYRETERGDNACDNGLDDDADGLIDQADPKCAGNPGGTTERAQCQDLIDNDGDIVIDSADFGCYTNGVYNPNDDTESSPKAQCQDGLDNDGDGLVDMNDPGCSTSQDNDETNPKPQCQDGVDNDGDGAVDFPADFSCSSASDNDEANPKAQCQDGIDNDADGLVDSLDPGCDGGRQDNDESNANTAGGCTDASTKSTKFTIDEAAQQLTNLTHRAADQLSKNAKKVGMSSSSMKLIKTDAQRAKKRAVQFQRQVEELLLGYPDVVKVCDKAPVTCNTVDRTSTILQLEDLYVTQLSAVKRIVARSYFNSVKSTAANRTDPIVLNAKASYALGNASLNSLPKVETVCK